jgi:hypothetical protein
MGLPLYRVTRGYENLFGWQAVPELAEGKRFFFETKKQKTFAPTLPIAPTRSHRRVPA